MARTIKVIEQDLKEGVTIRRLAEHLMVNHGAEFVKQKDALAFYTPEARRWGLKDCQKA